MLFAARSFCAARFTTFSFWLMKSHSASCCAESDSWRSLKKDVSSVRRSASTCSFRPCARGRPTHLGAARRRRLVTRARTSSRRSMAGASRGTFPAKKVRDLLTQANTRIRRFVATRQLVVGSCSSCRFASRTSRNRSRAPTDPSRNRRTRPAPATRQLLRSVPR